MNDSRFMTLIILGSLAGGILIGFLFCAGTKDAGAHPPCDAPPRCRYVQVVNPITGQLEQEYVCD